MAESLFRFVLSNAAVGTVEIDAPQDWNDMQHSIQRDSVYHGVAIKYSIDFTFVKSGLNFIRTVYNTEGIEGEILMIVYELDANAHNYVAAYSGRINLSKYVATEDNCTTNAEESGFTRRILNLDDVSVDLSKLISLDGKAIAPFAKEVENVALHSKAIVQRFEGYVTANQPEYSYRPLTNEEEYFGTMYIGFDDIKHNELNIYNYNTGLELTDGRDELVQFKERGQITVDYSLNVTVECLLGDKGDFDAAFINFYLGLGPIPPDRPGIAGRGNAPRIYHWNNREVYGAGDNINGDLRHLINITGTAVFDVNIGDKLYFYGDVGLYSISQPTFGKTDFEWRINANVGTSLKIKGATTTDPTAATVMMLHEAFARVIQSITGRNNAFYSELLGRTDAQPTPYTANGELSFLSLTNGSQIRGFPLVERPIFATFKELFSSTNAIKPIGIGTEMLPDGTERVRLEGVEYFYQPIVVLELGMVKDLKLSVAQEYFFNQTQVGYEKWGSNADNSLDEPNTKQTRVLPITQLKNSYSAVSKYSASGYLIEQTRREQFNTSPDKETGEDKTNFWVCLLRKNGGGYETERNQLLNVVKNVLSPDSAYNLRITPQRNFKRHGRIIRSGLRFRDTRPIIFQEGNANYIAETQFFDESVSTIENEPLIGTQLVEPLWIPEYYEFDAPLPAYQRKLIEANPHRLITFMDSAGNLKKGYLKDIRISLTGPMATFKLLRANL